MKLSDITEIHLVAVIAGATFLGGIGSSLLGTLLVGADTERQTDVQIVQVAIGILSDTDPTGSTSPESVLRAWAVDTINSASDVKLDSQARDLLISGEAGFPAIDKNILESFLRGIDKDMEDIEEMIERLKMIDQNDGIRPIPLEQPEAE